MASIYKIVIISILQFILIGCAAGTFVSSVQTSNIDDKIILNKQQIEFADISKEVCNELGYKTKFCNNNSKNINCTFSDDESVASGLSRLFLGHSNPTTINLYTDDQGRTWIFEISARGNFGKGSIDALKQRWINVKTEIIAKTKSKYPDLIK